MTGTLDMLAVATMLAMVSVASWTDVRHGRIPNALTVPCALFGIALWLLADGLVGLGLSLAGLALGMAPFLIAYLSRAGGAGDAKLMGAVGALLGPERALFALLLTFIAGGVIVILWALYAWAARRLTTLPQRSWRALKFLWVTGRLPFTGVEFKQAMSRRLPFAPAIAVGSALAVFWPQLGLP